MNKVNIFKEVEHRNKQRFEHNINQLKNFIGLLESNGYKVDLKKITILETSVEVKIHFPVYGLEEHGKDK